MVELATIAEFDESTIATTTDEVNVPLYYCDQCEVKYDIEENLKSSY